MLSSPIFVRVYIAFIMNKQLEHFYKLFASPTKGCAVRARKQQGSRTAKIGLDVSATKLTVIR